MKSLTKTKKILNKRKKKGFTLIELIIVVAIIGILSAIAIPKFGNAQKKAKENADLANAKIIQNAVVMAVSEGEIGETLEKINLNTTEAKSDGTDSEKAVYAIEKYINGNKIPAVNQDGYSFYLSINEGNVTVEPKEDSKKE